MNQLTKVFKALADNNRIRILKMLESRSLCVCEITDVLQLATSTVSKHLSILRDADLIIDHKDGKWVNFTLNPDQENEHVRHLLPLIRTWLKDDERIIHDKERVRSVDRNKMCGV